MAKGNRKKTGEGQYVPLPYAMLRSRAWRSLSGAAVKVFLELHTRFNGSNNGKVRLSYGEAADLLGMGKATVQRAFADLQAKGFVVLEQEGNWNHRQAHEWRLTTKPVQKVKGREPPSQDWLKWRPENSDCGSGWEQTGGGIGPSRNPKRSLGSELKPVRSDFRRAIGSGTEH